MRGVTISIGVFLLFVAAIPFGVYQFMAAEAARKERLLAERARRTRVIPGQAFPSAREVRSERQPPASEGGEGPGRGDSGVHPVELARPASAGEASSPGASVESAPESFALYGCYSLERLRPAASRQLLLRSRAGERPVWTGESGEFTFAVQESDFPLSLFDSAESPEAIDGSSVALLTLDAPISGLQYVRVQRLLPTRRYSGLIRPRRVTVFREVSGAHRVLVHGDSALPVGSTLFCRLLAAGKTVAASMRPVDESGVLGELTTQTKVLHSGRYKLTLAWKPSSAKGEELAQVASLVGKSLADLPTELTVDRIIYVGREADETAQEAEIRKFVRKALLEAQAARDLLLLTAWRTRGGGGEVAPATAPNGWKQEVRLLRDKRRLGVVAKSTLAPRVRSLGDRKSFDFTGWRRLIDVDLPERWRPFLESSTFPYPEKYPEVVANIPALYQQLLKLFHVESRLIYQELGRRPDPHDYVDFDWGPETERRETLRRVNTCWVAVRDGGPRIDGREDTKGK